MNWFYFLLGISFNLVKWIWPKKIKSFYQVLYISFQFGQFLIIKLLKKKKNPFKYLVRFYPVKVVLNDTTNRRGIQQVFPNRVYKILHSLNPEPLPKIRKTDSDNSPERGQQSVAP